nr:MAG TPA: hypothetical protein [Caudoviricetes sp.]
MHYFVLSVLFDEALLQKSVFFLLNFTFLNIMPPKRQFFKS